MGVAWLKVRVFQGKWMKRTPPCESSVSGPAHKMGRSRVSYPRYRLLFRFVSVSV